MSADRSLAVTLACGALWLALSIFVAPVAPYIIDGAMYHAMVEAAAGGSLFLDNGYATYRSEALAPTLTVGHDGRLAPQYPGGWGFLAAPAYMAGGLRGVMAMNAVAAAGAVWFISRTALRLTGDPGVAWRAALIFALAGFFTEYAIGVWPHAPAMLIAAAALASATRAGGAGEAGGALIAGLLIGLGAHIRVDALFLAPPLAIWCLWRAERPYRVLAALVLGMAPGLAAASWVNWVKFGEFSPATYGKSRGTTSAAHYQALAPLALAGGLALLSLGLDPVRALIRRKWIAPALIAGGVAIVAVLPMLQPVGVRFAQGYWALFFDSQTYPGPARSVEVGEDGVLRFFGLMKPALFQSLPFAPLALAAFMARRWREEALFLVAFAALASAPFAFSAWHGGLGNNMRYLLPAAMALAILAAMGWRALDGAGGRRWALGVAGLLLATPLLWAESGRLWADLAAPNLVLICGGLLSLGALVTGARLAIIGARGAAMAGFVIAAIAGLIDLRDSLWTRRLNAELAAITADLPGDALVALNATRTVRMRLNMPGALTGQADFRAGDLGAPLEALIGLAHQERRPVFLQGEALAQMAVENGLGARGEGRYGLPPELELYPLAPPGDEEP